MTVRSCARVVGERMPGLDLGSNAEHALIVFAFDRVIAADADTVWRSLSEPDSITRWLGPCRFGPNSRVDVLLTAEQDSPAISATIVDISEGSHVTLDLRFPEGTRCCISITLASDPRSENPETTVTAFQAFTAAEHVQLRGPLWEFYLDRLARSAEGSDLHVADVAPHYLPGLVPHFQALIRQAIRNGQQPEFYERHSDRA